MARLRSSPPDPSVAPNSSQATLPPPSPPAPPQQSRSPYPPDVQTFIQEVLTTLEPLNPTDIARMGGPGIFDLGFPDPIGVMGGDVETLGTNIRDHLLIRGTFKARYAYVIAELVRKSVFNAPQYALTILTRMAAAELFVQHCADQWGPPSPA